MRPHRRSLLLVALLSAVALPAAASGQFEDLLDKAKQAVHAPGTARAGANLPSSDIAAGLKEALAKGTTHAINSLGRDGGFWNNPKVRIPLPGKLEQAADLARKLGMGAKVDAFELSLNRAAEKAVPQVADIFGDAIRRMTLSDARELDKTVGGPFGFVAVHETLGDALLAGALDDCTRADLTDVDLLTVDLTGLRWSVRGTRWPTGTDIVLLITHSRETAEGSGVYVVMSPPTTLWPALLI